MLKSLKFIFISSLLCPILSHSRGHILIDPGHGGRDSGALVGTFKESDVVWKWALTLKRALNEKGFEVSLTRDESGRIPTEKRKSIARSSKYDLIVSLHANYLQDPRVKGVEYFIKNPLTLEDQKLQLAHEEVKITQKIKSSGADSLEREAHIATMIEDLKKQAHTKKSLKIARLLQDSWQGRLKQGPFDILHNAQAPAVLIELGFLSSPVDQKNLVDPSFILKQSQVMAQSLSKFFKTQESAPRNF